MHLSSNCKGFILFAISMLFSRFSKRCYQLKEILIIPLNQQKLNMLKFIIIITCIFDPNKKNRFLIVYTYNNTKIIFKLQKYLICCLCILYKAHLLNRRFRYGDLFLFYFKAMRGLKNQTNKTINYIDYIKPKRKSQPIIKSQGYRKKYEQGLPKLGDKKEIPFHNLYGVSVAANQLEKQNQPDPWATMSKDIRKNRLNNPQTCRNQVHTTFYDVFIQKYIHKNRKITRTKQEKKQFKTSSLKFHQPKIVFEYRKKSKSALQYVNQNTQQRLNEQKINNLFLSQKQPLILLQSTTGYGKSFKDMTLQQLRQGLTWKKTFLQELEKRKQQNRGKSFRKELNTVNFIIRKACQLDKVEEY